MLSLQAPGIDSRHDIKESEALFDSIFNSCFTPKTAQSNRHPYPQVVVPACPQHPPLTMSAAGTPPSRRAMSLMTARASGPPRPPHSGEYAEGNPGTTLGEQRKYAHEFAVRLTERIVWVEPRHPFLQYVLVSEDIGVAARAWGASGAPVQKPGGRQAILIP